MIIGDRAKENQEKGVRGRMQRKAWLEQQKSKKSMVTVEKNHEKLG